MVRYYGWFRTWLFTTGILPAKARLFLEMLRRQVQGDQNDRLRLHRIPKIPLRSLQASASNSPHARIQGTELHPLPADAPQRWFWPGDW